jgi:hypothetical protein
MAVFLTHVAVALVVPKLPDGRALRLTIPGYGHGVGTGGHVWPAASVLCRYLASRQQEVEGARVCELGSGIGAVGLYVAALGARSVVMTDMDPQVRDLAAENVEQNRALLCTNTSVFCRTFSWGTPIERLSRDPDFDLVLGSDITYKPRQHRLLCATLAELLLRDPSEGRPPSRAVIAHTHRPVADVLNGGVEGLEHLRRTASKAGLHTRTLHAEHRNLAKVSVVEMTLQQGQGDGPIPTT